MVYIQQRIKRKFFAISNIFVVVCRVRVGITTTTAGQATAAPPTSSPRGRAATHPATGRRGRRAGKGLDPPPP
jgi:hypothetical protein